MRNNRRGFNLASKPSGDGCVECLASHDGWWFHLRRCAECGHIGCCDSSPSQHAARHAKATGHPIITSFEPGERWFFDFAKGQAVKGEELLPPHAHPRTWRGSGELLPPMPTIGPIVFVVDDDVSVRESLEQLFLHEGWRSATFSSADDFLNCAPASVPSCLVLDVSLPGISGLELQQRIAKERADMPIITGHGDIPMTVRAMKSGAIKFLTKPFTNDAVLSAVQQALEYSRAALAERDEIGHLRESHATLSKREREVMALVVSGLPNKQVGAELGISEITVKAHRDE